MDRDSNRSIIVELLDLDEDCPDSEVADRIFRDCALANNATHVGLYSQRRLRNSEVPLLMKDPPCPPAWISLWVNPPPAARVRTDSHVARVLATCCLDDRRRTGAQGGRGKGGGKDSERARER